MTARKIKGTEYYTYFKEEDDKYNNILINRRHKDELVRLKHKAKNNLLKNIKKVIKDRELVSDYKSL
jgi:hypothetical protein